VRSATARYVAVAVPNSTSTVIVIKFAAQVRVAVANLVNMLLEAAQQPEVGRPSSLAGRKGPTGALSGLTAGDGEGKRIRELCATALEVRVYPVCPSCMGCLIPVVAVGRLTNSRQQACRTALWRTCPPPGNLSSTVSR
jgi:hypothetical protein